MRLLAQYNQAMNRQLYSLASQLPVEQLTENKGAFFGSIRNTLNHLLVADITWLRRFAKHPAQFAALRALDTFPAPTTLDQLLFDDFAEQFAQREQLDAIIIAWLNDLTEADIDTAFAYQNMKGLTFTRKLGDVLLHFFNHQTHHRGQTTTLLTQCGIDIGVTDLIAMIPEAN